MNGARFSPCGRYRYALWRTWDSRGTACCFVMLNPSTADADRNDPTIRRCIGFARSWGHGGVRVVNLFAYRASDPALLRKRRAIVGPDNDAEIVSAAKDAALVVCAWGTLGKLWARGEEVLQLLARETGEEPWVLGATKDGYPTHPLYVPGATKPVPMSRALGQMPRGLGA